MWAGIPSSPPLLPYIFTSLWEGRLADGLYVFCLPVSAKLLCHLVSEKQASVSSSPCNINSRPALEPGVSVPQRRRSRGRHA